MSKRVDSDQFVVINRVGLEMAKKELAGSIEKGISFAMKWAGMVILSRCIVSFKRRKRCFCDVDYIK